MAEEAKFESMQRYGKEAWSFMHMNSIDEELHLHWDNMLSSKDPALYFSEYRDKISFLLEVYQRHRADNLDATRQKELCKND